MIYEFMLFIFTPVIFGIFGLRHITVALTKCKTVSKSNAFSLDFYDTSWQQGV